MSLWQWLLHAVGRLWPSRRLFQFDKELIASLRMLSEKERRPEDEVAADLLAQALAERDAAEACLRRWRALSPREQDVAALVCLGCTNRQIAARLHISPETVKTHVRNVLYRFDLHSKAELRQALAAWDFSAWRGLKP